jgi:hypothetical protein
LSILWRSSFLAIIVVIEIIPPLVSFGIRFAVSGTVLLVAYYLSHRGRSPRTYSQARVDRRTNTGSINNSWWTRAVSLGGSKSIF